MTDELNSLAAAYALDALSEDERRTFEAHLQHCADCAEEVRSMRMAATELSHVSAIAPPEFLRANVLGAISQVRPLPPLTDPADHEDNVRQLRRVRTGRMAWQLVAAACALIAIIGSGWGWQQHRNADRVAARSDIVYSLLSAPDGRAVSGKVGATGEATMLYSVAQGRMVLVARDIPMLDKAKTYQAWTISAAGTATSAGVFVPDAHGGVLISERANLSGAAKLGVTVEPAGGSIQPTGTLVAAMDL